MKLLRKIDQFLSKQCKNIFGLIEPGAERVIMILARYAIVFVAPFVTPLFTYTEYPSGIKFLYYIFVWIWVFFAYCIILDLYLYFKSIIKYFINKKNHHNV